MQNIPSPRACSRSTVSLSLLFVAGVAIALVAGCPLRESGEPVKVVVAEGPPGAGPMSREAIIKAAREIEGELYWYTSAPRDDAERYLELFEAKHPYIEAHLVRGSTFDMVSRVNAQIEGDVEADVLHVLDVGAFIDLRRRGELLQYDTPEESAIRQQFRESGHWWAMRIVAIGMAYNTQTLSPDEAPKTWEDLLRPEFRGKIGFKDASTAGTAYAEYFLLRERLGTLFWERMARQNPRISRSASEVTAALLGGEILVAGEMAGYNVLESKQEGEPIAAVWPEVGVPFTPGPIAILARAPHPNAAKLFVDFALSKEGQEQFRELVLAYSARTDVDPLEGQPPLNSLNLLTPTGGWEEYLEKQTSLRAEFERLFRPDTE